MATRLNARLGLSVGTTPTNVIDANGSITANSVTVANTLAVGANVIANTTALFIGNSTVNTVITQSTFKIANATGTTLSVGTNGNIGIGNTTPTYKLQLDGGVAWFKPTADGSNAATLHLGRMADSDYPAFTVLTDDATGDTLTLKSERFNGYFDWKRNSANGETRVASLQGVNGARTEFSIYHTETDNTAKVRLSTGTDSYINGAANVGIGTSAPNAKFHVVGTANISANLWVGGATTIGNTLAAGNTTIIGFINVSSTANVGGAITARGDVTVNGALVVANTASLGNTTIAGFINVSSTANIGGALNARSDVTVNGALTVANTASLGNTTITGWANVTSNIQAVNVRTTGDVQIDGNLIVNGNTVTIGVTNLNVSDNMIYLNEASTANVTGATGNGTVIVYTSTDGYVVGHVVKVEGITPSQYNIGWTTITAANATTFSVSGTANGAYVSGGTAYVKSAINPDLGITAGYDDGTYRHTGFFRDATDGVWKVFDQYVPEPNGAFIDTSNTTFRIADFQSNNTVLGTANVAGNTFLGIGSVNYARILGAAAGAGPSIYWTGADTNVVGVYDAKGAGAHYFATSGTQQFRVSHTSSAVNYVNVTGAATGGTPVVSAQGADANVSLNIAAKGNAQLYLSAGSSGGAVRMSSAGAEQVTISGSGSAVNRITMKGGATGVSPQFAVQGTDTNIGLDYSTYGTGSHSFYTNDLNAGTGQLQFRIAHVANTTNYIQVNGNATLNAPILQASGSDTNIDLIIRAKGAWSTYIGSTQGTGAVFNAASSGVNYFQLRGTATGTGPQFSAIGNDTNIDVNYVTKGTGTHVFQTGTTSAAQFKITDTASAVNFVSLTGATTNNRPRLYFDGTDTNVGALYITKGTGGHSFTTDANASVVQFAVSRTASAVNYLQASGSATAGAPILSAQGSDTNVGITLYTKGTGATRLFTPTGVGGTATNTQTLANIESNSNAGTGNVLTLRASLYRHTTGTDWTGVSYRLGQVVDVTAMSYLDFNPVGQSQGLAVQVVNGAPFQVKTSGGEQFRISDTSSAVNFIQATGANTGSSPYMLFTGTDTNVSGVISTKGTGGLSFYSNGIAQRQLRVTHTASAVNFLDITGGATGAAPSIVASASSTDTDVGVAIAGKGAGKVNLNSNTVVVGTLAVTNSTSNVFAIAANGNLTIGTNTTTSTAISTTHQLHVAQVAASVRIGPSYTDGSGARDYLDLVTAGSETSILTNNEIFTIRNYNATGNTDITSGGSINLSGSNVNVAGVLSITGNTSLGNTTIAGNLTVTGTTTYINTSQLNVGDNVISLNADFTTGTPTENAGIEVIRGSSPTVQFMWNESRGKWGSYTTQNGQTAAIESYGNTATLNVTGYGNSTSNTSFSLTSDVSRAWAKFDTSTSTITDGVTAWLEMKTGSYRASGVFHTNEVAPYGGSNAFFFTGYNYTGTGWQIGLGTSPTDVSNSVFFVSKANSNIGIGNTTPQHKLVIQTTSNTQVVLNSLINADTGTGAQAIQRFISGGSSLTTLASSSGYAGMYGNANTPSHYNDFDNHYFRTLGGTVKAVFTANGNVGIGNSSPTHLLRVEGTTSLYGNVSSNGLVIDTTLSRVGINKALGALSHTLTLSTNYDGDGIQIQSQTGQTYGVALKFANSSGSTLSQLAGVNNPGNFVTGSTVGDMIALPGNNFIVANSSVIRMGVYANGSVGIGNTTPDAKLTVTGTANVSGVVTLGSDLIATGGNTSLGNTTITGNLTVTGTTTYVNTTTLNIGDNIITLNADLGASAPSENAGFEVNRGTSSNTSLYWDETNDRWTAYGGDSANVSLIIASNTYVRSFYTTSGSLVDQWGTLANPGGITEFIMGSGVNMMDTKNRNFFFSNGSVNNAIISANGNVGIGNTAPIDKLTVNGNTVVLGKITALGGGSNSALVIGNTVSGGAYLQVTPNAGAGAWSNFTSVGDNVIISSNNTQNNGNLVIGMWSSFGAAGYGHGIKLTGNTYDIALGGNTISVSNGSTTTALFAANGNLGLGNTAPGSKLTIKGSSADANTTSGIAIDVQGAVIRVGDGSGTAQTFANGVGLKIADQGNVHYSIGQIGGKLVLADTSGDQNSLFPASRTDIISANSTWTTFNTPIQLNSYIQVGNFAQNTLGLTTSATTANQVVSLAGITTWRTMKILVQVTSGSAYQSTEITLMHDGTNVYKSEYGTVYSGAVLATFDADINSGNMRLLTTPVNAVTVYKGMITYIAV